MKKLLCFIILLNSLFTAYPQFIQKQKVYDINDGDKAFWEKMYKFPITLDTAKYYNGDIIYTRKLESGTFTFRKYHGGGKLHVLGEKIELRQKKNKTIPFSGDWTTYHYNLNKKKEISFEKGRKVELKIYSESGELIKNKKFNQKFTYGFHMGFERSNLNIKSEGDTILSEGSSNGHNQGFLVEYQLSKKFDIRSLISTSFHDYTLQFELNDQPENIKADYIIFRLPLTIVYRITDNFAILNGVGANLRIEGEELKNSTFETKAIDLNFDTGILYEFRFNNFIAAPELRYSPQISNWIKPSLALYSKNVSQLRRSDFSFSIIFKSKPIKR